MKMKYLILALALVITGIAHGDMVQVQIYSGHSTVGGGSPFSGLVGTFDSPDIQFATNTGYAWHPFGLSDFGAHMTGFLDVVADGTYTFTLDSDDGSLLYIDGGLVVDNGGPHSPAVVSDSTFLTAGVHSFTVDFFEDFGGPSGVDLDLPSGVTYVPAPGAVLLGILGLSVAGVKLRKRA